MNNKMTNSIMKGAGDLRHNFDKEYRMETKGYSEEDNIILINYSQESDLKNVYKELFGEALEEYNKNQKRKDRKIPDYYNHIKTGKQEKLFFEIIIACGNCIDNADQEELQIEMLKEIHEKMITSYSNFKFFGSTIHLDEEGVPHLHLDFVPFVTNSEKRGLSTRVSMDGALKEMGFKPEKPRMHETYHDKKGNEREKRINLFNAFRNSISDICKEIYTKHDVELIHLDNGKQVHYTVEEYKEKEAIKMAAKELIATPTQQVIDKVIEDMTDEEKQKIVNDIKEEIKPMVKEEYKKELEEQKDDLKEELGELQLSINDLSFELNNLQIKKRNEESKIATDLEKARNQYFQQMKLYQERTFEKVSEEIKEKPGLLEKFFDRIAKSRFVATLCIVKLELKNGVDVWNILQDIKLFHKDFDYYMQNDETLQQAYLKQEDIERDFNFKIDYQENELDIVNELDRNDDEMEMEW